MTGSNITWSLTALALAACAAIAATFGGTPNVLIAVAAVIAALFALFAILSRSALHTSGASRSRIAASSAASMALVWIWGALAIVVTYQFIIPPWREWWHFGLAFAVAGAACLFFSSVHARDAAANRDDETMLKLGRGLAIAQLLGTLATMVGLILDPNKTFQDIADPAWAANIIFFAGAAALAAISAHAILTDRTSKA